MSSKTSHLHKSWNSCTKRTEISLNMKRERWTSGPWREPFCLQQGTEQPHGSICHCYPAMAHFHFAYFMEGSFLGSFILNWIILTSMVWQIAKHMLKLLTSSDIFTSLRVGGWCQAGCAPSLKVRSIPHFTSQQFICHICASTAEPTNSRGLSAHYWLCTGDRWKNH